MKSKSQYPKAAARKTIQAFLAGVSLVALGSAAQAQSVIDLCAGPRVSLPVLTPVTTLVDTSIVAATLNPILSGLVGNINTNLTGALSGQQLGVSVLDVNGNLVSVPPAGGCVPGVNNANGITLGGGVLDGLGGTGNTRASAGAATAIAIGNGAATSPGVDGALALGTNATTSVAGGVALGAGSEARRLNAGTELFTGAGLRSTLGVVSVGTATNERQIINVAGGTQATDAVNLRQLTSVGNTLSGALGGGAAIDPATGAFTAPTYVVNGGTYNNVGAALAAIPAVATSLVQQAGATAPITVGAASGGGDVNIAGTAGTRTLSGLTAGAVAPGSTQAVTGAQLAATNAGVTGNAAALGGGTTFNPATGIYSGPTFTIGGAAYFTVSSALEALDARIDDGTGPGGGGVNFPIAGNSPDGRIRPLALGRNSVAGGYQAMSGGEAGSSLGDSARAMGNYSTSIGGQSQAMAEGSTALGAQSAAMDFETTALGGRAKAMFQGSTAVGANAQAIADPTTAIGYFATASGIDAVAVGAYTVSSGNFATVVGTSSVASGLGATAIGHSAGASGDNAVAIGMNAVASSPGAIAIGVGSVANRQNAAAEAFSAAGLNASLGALSVGSAGNERQITNVAGGTDFTDAVNVRQLRSVGNAVTASLGGGASFDAVTGAYTGPTYNVQGVAYGNVGSAIGALDRGAVKYDIDPATGGASNTITLAGGDPNTPVLVRNVAAGVVPTDAANIGQVAAAQQAGRTYTDARAADTLQQARTYTDQQIAAANFGNDQAFARLNQDIREVRREARQAAAVGLAASSLRFDDRPGKISLAAGGGAWRGEGGAAFGLGYTSSDGLARVNASASTAGGQWGVAAGLSLTLN